MQGKLYYNSSDYNYANKSLNLLGSVMNLHFKEESEIVNPTIYISTDYKSYISKANYLYVATLNRYYFIDDITQEHQRYILKCRCDVLSSIYPYVKNKTVISKRSANHFNLFINDDRLNLRAETRTLTLPFDSGFERVGGGKDFDFVLTVNGGGATS